MQKLNRVRVWATLAALPLAGCATSAIAQPVPIESIDQEKAIERVNVESVGPALAVVTGNQIVGMDGDSVLNLAATATNGLRFEVNFRACENEDENADMQHCKAVYMISIWDAPAADRRAALPGTMVSYLRDNPAMNAGMLETGEPYVIRYVITDYGTTQGNMVSEFSNFIRSATGFQNTIAPLYEP